MADQKIVIEYLGGDADHHSIDMRQLAQSLDGLERIISSGVIALSAKRPPMRGERAPLIVKVKEPVKGSWQLPAFLQETSGLLQLGWSVINTGGSDLIWNWVKATLIFHGGKEDKAMETVDKLLDNQRAEMAARDRAEERHFQDAHEWRELLRDVIIAQKVPANDAVAPVGNSVRKLNFTTDDRPPVEVDEPLADAIRERSDLELSDLRTIRLRTDGFVFHNRKLNVENPLMPGRYLSAEVRDPIFKEEGNPYTQAAAKKAMIEVQAKLGYRGDRLERIYIMDFGGEIDDAA